MTQARAEVVEPSISPFWDEVWAEPPIEDEPYDDVPPDADQVSSTRNCRLQRPSFPEVSRRLGGRA